MSASLPGVVAFVHRLHTIASIHVTLFLIVNDNNVSQCMYYNKPVLYIYNSWDEAMFQVVMTFNNVSIYLKQNASIHNQCFSFQVSCIFW